jgi:hypothetical protein
VITPSTRLIARYFFVRRFGLVWLVIVIMRLAVGNTAMLVWMWSLAWLVEVVVGDRISNMSSIVDVNTLYC